MTGCHCCAIVTKASDRNNLQEKRLFWFTVSGHFHLSQRARRGGMHYSKQRKAETREQAVTVKMPTSGDLPVPMRPYLLKALPAGQRHSEQEPVGILQGQTITPLLTVAQSFGPLGFSAANLILQPNSLRGLLKSSLPNSAQNLC